MASTREKVRHRARGDQQTVATALSHWFGVASRPLRRQQLPKPVPSKRTAPPRPRHRSSATFSRTLPPMWLDRFSRPGTGPRSSDAGTLPLYLPFMTRWAAASSPPHSSRAPKKRRTSTMDRSLMLWSGVNQYRSVTPLVAPEWRRWSSLTQPSGHPPSSGSSGGPNQTGLPGCLALRLPVDALSFFGFLAATAGDFALVARRAAVFVACAAVPAAFWAAFRRTLLGRWWLEDPWLPPCAAGPEPSSWGAARPPLRRRRLPPRMRFTPFAWRPSPLCWPGVPT